MWYILVTSSYHYVMGQMPYTSLSFPDLPQYLCATYTLSLGLCTSCPYSSWHPLDFTACLVQRWYATTCLLKEGRLHVTERQILPPLLIGCTNLL